MQKSVKKFKRTYGKNHIKFSYSEFFKAIAQTIQLSITKTLQTKCKIARNLVNGR